MAEKKFLIKSSASHARVVNLLTSSVENLNHMEYLLNVDTNSALIKQVSVQFDNKEGPDITPFVSEYIRLEPLQWYSTSKEWVLPNNQTITTIFRGDDHEWVIIWEQDDSILRWQHSEKADLLTASSIEDGEQLIFDIWGASDIKSLREIEHGSDRVIVPILWSTRPVAH